MTPKEVQDAIKDRRPAYQLGFLLGFLSRLFMEMPELKGRFRRAVAQAQQNKLP